MAILRAARFKQLKIAGGIASALAIAAALFWFFGKSKLPTPDDRVLSDLRIGLSRFDQLPRELKPRAAAEMLHDLESERLPAAQRELFEKAQGRGFSSFKRVVFEAIEEGQLKDDWRLACPEGGPMLFDDLADKKVYEQGTYVFRRCELDRFGFLTEDEAGKADVGYLVAAYMAYAFLEHNNALLDEEEALLRHFTNNTAQLAMERGGPFW